MTTRFTDLSRDEKVKHLLDCLNSGVATVTFTKVDGDVRVMPCTLNELLVPPTTVKRVAPTIYKPDPAVMRVFCTDKQAWRSFRIDSVTNVTPDSVPAPL